MTKTNVENENTQEINMRISYALLFLLLINYFISSEIFLVIIFCYLIFLILVKNRGVLIINTGTNMIYLILIMFMGIAVGFFNIDNYSIREIIRDVFYILNPIIFILLGVYIQKTWKCEYDIYKTIIVFAVVLSLINIFSIVSNIEIIKSASNIGALRTDVVNVGISVVLGAVLLLSEEKRGVEYFNKKTKALFIMLFMVVIILSFSRTNFISFFVLLAVVNMGKIKMSSGILKRMFIVVICAMIIGFIIYEFVPVSLIYDFFVKLSRSVTELDTDNNWRISTNITENWRGYEIYRAQRTFLAGNVLERVLGYGFGNGIDVGKYAHLVMPGANTTIPLLHNGYYTMLIKNGIVGLILYLTFYLANIKTALKYIKDKSNVYEAKVFLGCLFVLILTTYFISGIISKSGFFVFCFFIGYICSNLTIIKNEK